MNRFEVRGSMQRRRRPLLTGRLAMSSAFRVAPAFVMGVATDWTAAIAEGEASCVRVISPMAEAGTARALAWEFALFGAIEEGKEGNHGNEMANHSKELLLVMAMVSDLKSRPSLAQPCQPGRLGQLNRWLWWGRGRPAPFG